MGKREINQTIKLITQMLEITTTKKQRSDLNKILKQAKLDWQELDDKAPKRKHKKQVVKVAPRNCPGKTLNSSRPVGRR